MFVVTIATPGTVLYDESLLHGNESALSSGAITNLQLSVISVTPTAFSLSETSHISLVYNVLSILNM